MAEGEAVPEGMVPASEAAYQLGDYRESVLRRIQRGDLAGALVEGRWYVQKSAIDAHHSRTKAVVEQIRADAIAKRAAAKADQAARDRRIAELSGDHRTKTPDSLRHMTIGESHDD